MNKKHEEIRKKLREYRLLKNELECRTKYIEDFKKILITPLPQTEEAIHRIYKTITDDMECKAKKLQKRLDLLNRIIDRLDGNLRSIIYFRYVIGIDWLSMPEYMLYEQRTCQIFEKNALEQIEKMNIRWEDYYA